MNLPAPQRAAWRDPHMTTVVATHLHVCQNAFNMRSLWSREQLGSMTDTSLPAVRPASRRADFTWAEATEVPITPPCNRQPLTVGGARVPWIGRGVG